jgi:ABC-type sugar transport system ATPase subunit
MEAQNQARASELPELLHVCHRILVMSAGEIRDELKEPEFSEQRILAAAFAGRTRPSSE